ncbi:hypothetical protein M2103_001943 [Ereboglobus sp. PH5-5]|uniref:hypothetical protein n=1 Tax=Ereboglobus sp. PH5-5 TaxID=2940529 RepID=UPI0024064F48|nr:hypothetical protein [Ereboglobus sp. PH5-5]MDF9833710.1 hypothetical protein [Ereboglobus sp. PH5-5]
MKTLFKFFLITISVSSASISLSQDAHPEYVSMISLISNPERYENKLIRVRGYFFHSSSSYNFLYDNIEDHKGGLLKNSIGVHPIPKNFQIPEQYKDKIGKKPLTDVHAKYVTFTGRFRQHLPYRISSLPTGIIEVLFFEDYP